MNCSILMASCAGYVSSERIIGQSFGQRGEVISWFLQVIPNKGIWPMQMYDLSRPLFIDIYFFLRRAFLFVISDKGISIDDKKDIKIASKKAGQQEELIQPSNVFFSSRTKISPTAMERFIQLCWNMGKRARIMRMWTKQDWIIMIINRYNMTDIITLYNITDITDWIIMIILLLNDYYDDITDIIIRYCPKIADVI